MHFISRLTRIAAADALSASGLSLAASPAAAQGVGDMPSIAYPAAGTRWGCRFNVTCDLTGARPEPRGNRRVERNAGTAPGAAPEMLVPPTVSNRLATRVDDPTAEPRPNGGTLARAGVSRSADSR